MQEQHNNQKVISGFFWRVMERFGAKGVTFVVSIVLARLLDPVVYGTVALITVITSVLQVFVDSGLGSALIQKKGADDTDFSTVFYFNSAVCLVLYTALFFASPLISSFYNRPDMTSLIRVLGLLLIISGVKNIQNAYVSRHLMFKKYFFATLGGTVAAGVVGIWMAYRGYGVWALITQNLVNQLIDTIILWFTVKWRPKLLFSWERLKGLLSYGWKLLVSSFLNTLWTQLRQLIIGKKYTSEDLAYYNKGHEFPYLATNAITTSIDSVLLPVMSQQQDDPSRVRDMTRRAIKIGSFVLWPLMVGLAACADGVISLLLTEKWMFAVPYLRLFCIVFAFYPIHTANLNAIKALGRSDLFLKLEVIKKIVDLVTILVAMQFGVFAIAISALVNSIFGQIINSWPNRKILQYNYLDQLRDMAPAFFLSLIMGGVILAVDFLPLPTILVLAIQVIVGVVVYFGLAHLAKVESYTYCMKVVKNFLKKKKKAKAD